VPPTASENEMFLPVISMPWNKLLPVLVSRLRHLVLFVVLLTLPGTAGALALSEADRTDIARIEKYLNSISTLKSRFVQVSPNGALSAGGFWLKRPGWMRFEYDPPVPYLVLASQTWLIFIDAELGQPQHWPINETPFSVLVDDTISLSRNTSIETIKRGPGRIAVTLRHKTRPDDGTISLVFSDQPLILRQWRIIDTQGLPTTVTLDQIERGLDLPIDLFVPPKEFRPEMQR